MELIETRSRVQDVLFDTNRGLPYIHSRQIQTFFDRVETKFNILINDPLWDQAKLFVSKFPDLCIDKDIFLDFLGDLLQLDFVKYVHDESDTRAFEVPSSLGSPLTIPGKKEKTDDIFTDSEFEKLNRHIDEGIAKLGQPHDAPTTKTLQPPPATKIQTKRKPQDIHEIKLSKLLQSGIRNFTYSLPLINTLLLVILIILLLSQYISLRKHVYPVIRRVFLYDTTNDIYWWQRWSATERLVWTLLEYIQDTDE